MGIAELVVRLGEGRVLLTQARAQGLPWPHGTFAGVVAVNSVQLWEPLGRSVGEVARVLAVVARW